MVRGRGRNLFAGAAILAVLAASIPAGLQAAGNPPPWENVQRIWLIAAAVVAVLLAAGGFYASRRAELSARSIRISSLFGERYLPVGEVSAVTIQTLGGIGQNDYPSDHLAIWCGESVWARLDLRTWDRTDLGDFVGTLVRMRPEILVAPEVCRALDVTLAPLIGRDASCSHR